MHDVGPLFGEAYLKAATTNTALSAFQSTGISPLNPDIFHLFAPSETTNRNILEESIEPLETPAPESGQALSTKQPSSIPPPVACEDEPQVLERGQALSSLLNQQLSSSSVG